MINRELLLNFLLQPRTAFLITLLVSIFALGAALIGQFVFDLKPCEMCLWQRIPYVLLIFVSMIALAAKRTNRPFLVLIILFLASAGLAFFHFGIEQHWWALEQGCKVGELKGKSEAEIIAEILATPQAECDKVVWSILGLSITVWNTALSLGMAGYLGVVAFRNRK